ncbi:MAG: hypothetical protein MI923_26260 [Phycisphaerales bacterium]|nr:hypothetical protein [Phycisphaerales bacterium]
MAENHKCLFISLAVLITLVVWLDYWPYSGEGDAILHYRNLREGVDHPEVMLTAWARPLYAAVMVLPASYGMYAARIAAAILTTVLVWQTMRMADDLGLRNSKLAGPMVLWQPYAFALAADTMTEMPMALGIVLAIRLWLARRLVLSSLMVSFLPLVRPEGFFLMLMWATMLWLPSVTSLNRWQRLRRCALLGTGMLCWMAACALIVGDPLYVIRTWSWPAGSYVAYGNGALFDYAAGWPEYCGPILFPIFILGIFPSMKSKMWLPWAVWSMVFLLHSILWWRGWFASVGLLRILACTSPLTALICLEGWNLIGRTRFLAARASKVRTCATILAVLTATSIPMLYYVNDAQNHHPKLIVRAVNYVKTQCLLDPAPAFFVSDELVLELLELPPRAEQLKRNPWNREAQQEMLKSLPPGSLGIWDNHRGKLWFNIDIEELPDHGYEVLFETEHSLRQYDPITFGLRNWPVHQRCVVVRKLRQDENRNGVDPESPQRDNMK